jgi:hypothetical protein
MKTPSPRRNRGVALLDCLVYLTLLACIMGFGFAAFLETVGRSTELDYVATSTVQVLHAGEQWREDVRQSKTPPVIRENGTEIELQTSAGIIRYAVQGSTLRRRAGEPSPWVDALSRVKASRFAEERRTRVTAWRWEIELETRQDRERASRVFTFQAVPKPSINK